MTNPTPTSGAADLPEALRLANVLELAKRIDYYNEFQIALDGSATELLRQHTEITDLRAQLESIGAGGVSGRLVQATSAEPAAHVQNPAENEHVADDMSKNETGSNTAQPAPPADSVLEDAARLDWLLLRISGAEFRRLGVHYSGNARRADVDAARKQGGSHDPR